MRCPKRSHPRLAGTAAPITGIVQYTCGLSLRYIGHNNASHAAGTPLALGAAEVNQALMAAREARTLTGESGDGLGQAAAIRGIVELHVPYRPGEHEDSCVVGGTVER